MSERAIKENCDRCYVEHFIEDCGINVSVIQERLIDLGGGDFLNDYKLTFFPIHFGPNGLEIHLGSAYIIRVNLSPNNLRDL